MESVLNGMIGMIDAQQTGQLQVSLERITAYARALETRCNVLWTYVPGNQGNQDPIVQFIAEDLGIVAHSAMAEVQPNQA